MSRPTRSDTWFANGRQLRFRVPRTQPGDKLTAAHMNLIADAINGQLIPPTDLTRGVVDDGNRLRFAPVEGRVVLEGRVENPEDSDQYVIARNVTQIVVRITPEMLPIQAGDLWIISDNEDGSIDPNDEMSEVFDTTVESWRILNGQIIPVV